MEYYEVSPVSQRIAWLNGQHMKMTAGLTALSWALGCLYDSRHPQVVWEPGCSVKLDRPKVSRVKAYSSHLHPVSCPASVTTAVQTGTYLTFYVENFHTVDQCVLELEGLWRVHKESIDDSDHRNKIWIIRIDTTETHNLQSYQPRAVDIFDDLSMLAPDFFTTRGGSKTQRLSPTKTKGKPVQQKKRPSYKTKSKKRSSKPCLSPLTATRIMQQALTQCQQNLQDAEAVGGSHSEIKKEREGLAYFGSVAQGEEGWNNAENGTRSQIEKTNCHQLSNNHCDEVEDGDWSESGGDSWSDVNEGRGETQNCEDQNYVLEPNLVRNTSEIQRLFRKDTEKTPLISENQNSNATEVQNDRGHVTEQLDIYNNGVIDCNKGMNGHINSQLKQRWARSSISTSVAPNSYMEEPSQTNQAPRNRDCNGRGIADSIRRVHESFNNPTSSARNSMAPALEARSPSLEKSHEKEVAKTNTEQEPEFTEVEQHHQRMLVDLSRHEVVVTWLYDSDEEDDDDDDDEGIYKKEEAFFRVDVTGLLHELPQPQPEIRPSNPNLNPSASEDKRPEHLNSSQEMFQAETQTAFTANSANDERLSKVHGINEIEKRSNCEGEILREVQPSAAGTNGARIKDSETGLDLDLNKIKEESHYHFKEKNVLVMTKDTLLRTNCNINNSEEEREESNWKLCDKNQDGLRPEAQALQYDAWQGSITQPAETEEEEKENSVSSAYKTKENKFNLRNMVQQFEALSLNTVKSDRKLTGIGSRKNLFNQNPERWDAQDDDKIEGSSKNSEIKPHSVLKTWNSQKLEKSGVFSQDSQLTPPASQLTPRINTQNESCEIHKQSCRKIRQFNPSSNDSFQHSENKFTTQSTSKQIYNTKSEHTITLGNEKSGNLPEKFKTDSVLQPKAEKQTDTTTKVRSESSSQIFVGKPDPPRRSTSVTPTSHSMTSSLAPDSKQTSSQDGNPDFTASLGDAFERLDRSGRNSPKSKSSVSVVKKQLSKSKEVRAMSSSQQNSISMHNGIDQIPDIEHHREKSLCNADTLHPNRTLTLCLDPHKTDESFTPRNNDAIFITTKAEDQPSSSSRLSRNQASKDWENCCLADSVTEKSVPESALVVFKLQPSTPHQAWQFKKAILKVHHRDNAKKKEDKTTLRRNAHLLRKRR